VKFFLDFFEKFSKIKNYADDKSIGKKRERKKEKEIEIACSKILLQFFGRKEVFCSSSF
jgi:hypothetical protein